MERRDVLTGLGTVLGAGTVTGCVGGDRATPADTTTTPPEPTIVATAAIGDRASVAFPDNTRPHRLLTVNRSDIERKVEVFVERDETTIYERLDHLQPAEAVRLRFVEPATYTVRIRVGSTPGATVDVPRDRFDCNHSTTRATVGPGGVVETTSWSTMKACPGPTVEGTEFAVTDQGCASQEDGTATIRTVDGSVVVEGTLIVPTPCYRAGVRSVTLTDGVLTVVVEQRDSAEDGACIECVGGIAYRATVTLANAYPSTVVVEHADGNTTTVVGRVDL